MSIDDEKSEREGGNLCCKSNLAYEFISKVMISKKKLSQKSKKSQFYAVFM